MRRRPLRGHRAVLARGPLPLLPLSQAFGDVRAHARPRPAKVFCSVCGSSLFGGTWPKGPEVSIRFGALDGDPGIRPQFHTYVDSRAPWDELADDGLPRYPENKTD